MKANRAPKHWPFAAWHLGLAVALVTGATASQPAQRMPRELIRPGGQSQVATDDLPIGVKMEWITNSIVVITLRQWADTPSAFETAHPAFLVANREGQLSITEWFMQTSLTPSFSLDGLEIRPSVESLINVNLEMLVLNSREPTYVEVSEEGVRLTYLWNKSLLIVLIDLPTLQNLYPHFQVDQGDIPGLGGFVECVAVYLKSFADCTKASAELCCALNQYLGSIRFRFLSKGPPPNYTCDGNCGAFKPR